MFVLQLPIANFLKMWRQIESTKFYIYFSEYDVSITDFVALWTVYFTKTEFLKCLQDSNPTLEIESDILIEKGKKILTDPTKLKSVETNQERDILNVSISISSGYLFKVKLKLTEASKDLFFHTVTQQLLKMVQELKSSETQLRSLLKKKDKEIDEYKLKGGELALLHLKTKPFNDEAHMVIYRMYDEQFGSEVPAALLTRTVEIPKRIKKEPDTQLCTTSTVKEKPSAMKVEQPTKPTSEVKTEISTSSTEVLSSNESLIKIEPKSEPISQTDLVSPRKRLRRRFNI